MTIRTHFSSLLLTISSVFLLMLMSTACDKTTEFKCSDTLGCINISPGKPIEIGVLQALTGGLKDSGLMQVRGIELAVAKHEKQLLGHPIKLQIEDSGCSTEMGVNAALILTTTPKIVGIIGTYCSGAATAAIPIVSKAGLVMISGTNSAPSLTSINGQPGSNWQSGYYRTMYNGIKMAEMAAVFAFQELGKKNVATINDGDNFTLELTREFERKFTELGGKIVRSIGINKGDMNMGPVLEAIAYSKPELIYFPLFEPEAIKIIEQIKKTPGLERTVLVGSGGARSARFLEEVGQKGIGLYMTATKSLDSEAYQNLMRSYEIQYKEKPYHFSLPHVYDATSLLLNAIESVAVKEPDGTLHIGRKSLRNALYSTTDFEGVTGRLTCDPYGDLFGGAYAMIQLEDLSAGLDGFNANIKFLYK